MSEPRRIEDLPFGCHDGEHSWDHSHGFPQTGDRCICGEEALPEGRWVEATPEHLDELYLDAWLGHEHAKLERLLGRRVR